MKRKEGRKEGKRKEGRRKGRKEKHKKAKKTNSIIPNLKYCGKIIAFELHILFPT